MGSSAIKNSSQYAMSDLVIFRIALGNPIPYGDLHFMNFCFSQQPRPCKLLVSGSGRDLSESPASVVLVWRVQLRRHDPHFCDMKRCADFGSIPRGDWRAGAGRG